MPHDDLGHPFALPHSAERVVSLVPSLTEALASVRPECVAGATDWCTHPASLDVPRVRGTKNPDLGAIRLLAPDVVVANKEENRELDVRRLRAAGIPVWVTEIDTLDGANMSLGRLFDALRWPRPDWLTEAQDVWRAPPTLPPTRVAVPIWRDPWMVLGRDTFAGDLLRRLGLVHVFEGVEQRYPYRDPAQIEAAGVELVLLPDEPYAFTATDGPKSFSAPTALISGRSLTWYGPSLVTARGELTAAVRDAG